MVTVQSSIKLKKKKKNTVGTVPKSNEIILYVLTIINYVIFICICELLAL